ncbi:DUF4238 domain-containing protein [Blastococcus sp. MG754426]|uniref:DUF4238 domain-containing protein n=1 Tax=unclassified Blastococcus TaxID=2619396 RepID=UPI001EF01BA5|nr:MULTISPECIES: DUF4238 domain-containing protein [unclassified Blastococcus]MCF6506855.1 DUF4238 domain-containing protein [Blastococcus sp. MG754426]MCF6511655.1 DUF4238 domain-containing protein [Blastococcus sp. MG754427]
MSLVRVPRKQHTVSRVLLRRFAKGGTLTAYDRQKDVLTQKGPGGAFWVEHFDQHDPLGAEERAGAVESRVPEVLARVDGRTVLDDDDAVSALIDLMALHWVRSPAVRMAHERVKAAVVSSSKRRLASQEALLSLAFTQRTGLHAATRGELEWMNEQMHEIEPKLAEEWWSDRLILNFRSARQIMGRHSLQVGYFDEPVLVIGDSPVIVRNADGSGLGPHQGVALGDASEICMPIGPQVLIALGPASGTVQFDSAAADRFNEMQALSFVRWLGAAPSSPAESWMQERLRPARTYGPH